METAKEFLNQRLVNLALPLRQAFGLVIVISLAGGLLVIAQAAILSQVISRVFLGHQALSQVSTSLWILLAIISGRAVLAALSEGLAGQCAIQIKTTLRERLFRKFFELGPAYVQGKASGELANRALQGVENLDAYFSQYLPQVILAVILPVCILVFVFPLDILSGIILLVTAPLIPVFMYLIGKYAETLTRRQFTALGRLSAVFLDTLQGLATLKALGQAASRGDKIRVASERYRSVTLSVLRVTFLSALVLELVGTLSTAVVAVEIGLRLLNSQLDFSQAFFILVIAPEFYLPLRQLGLRFHAAAAGVSAERSIFEVLDTPVPATHQTAAATLIDKKGGESQPASVEIDFDHVSFSYPERNVDALQDASFTIQPFTLTMLVGRSGSGKSTAAQLLLRLVEPQSGRLLVNGRPLGDYDVREWRRLVAWAPQRPYLFQASIAANLRIARKNASLDEILHAIALAGLSDFVQSLPAGLDTVIGERGARLSGGQAQRLSLARAFLRDAPLLLLDEPEANLDPEIRQHIENSILQLRQDRTVVVIGHHLPALQRSSQIVVFENGRVTETGRHGSLMERGGAYARLVSREGDEP